MLASSCRRLLVLWAVAEDFLGLFHQIKGKESGRDRTSCSIYQALSNTPVFGDEVRVSKADLPSAGEKRRGIVNKDWTAATVAVLDALPSKQQLLQGMLD